jgi:hemolysin activation/secretion protein
MLAAAEPLSFEVVSDAAQKQQQQQQQQQEQQQQHNSQQQQLQQQQQPGVQHSKLPLPSSSESGDASSSGSSGAYDLEACCSEPGSEGGSEDSSGAFLDVREPGLTEVCVHIACCVFFLKGGYITGRQWGIITSRQWGEGGCM